MITAIESTAHAHPAGITCGLIDRRVPTAVGLSDVFCRTSGLVRRCSQQPEAVAGLEREDLPLSIGRQIARIWQGRRCRQGDPGSAPNGGSVSAIIRNLREVGGPAPLSRAPAVGTTCSYPD